MSEEVDECISTSVVDEKNEVMESSIGLGKGTAYVEVYAFQ
jgi:hypothetical protein